MLYEIFISHVLNEQGTEYEQIFSWFQYSISIGLKNGARHRKEHPNISKLTKIEGYWFRRKAMVHLVRIGGTGVQAKGYCGKKRN